jgi:hypothetical protein
MVFGRRRGEIGLSSCVADENCRPKHTFVAVLSHNVKFAFP